MCRKDAFEWAGDAAYWPGQGKYNGMQHMRKSILPAILCLVSLAACSSSPTEGKGDEGGTQLATMPVTLPNGKTIRAELATDPASQERGLMYRTSLAPDRGMLFVFGEAGNYPFWMYHTLIPLDIIWMDSNRTVVYISADTPPCRSEKAEECPNYGGGERAQFVLELAAGQAAANGLKTGDRLRF